MDAGTANANNRRNHRRVPFSVLFNKVEQGIATVCQGIDLSPHAIAFEPIGGPLRQGDAPVILEFQLPTSPEVLLAQGKAVRQEGRRLCIAFTQISRRHQAMIEGFIGATQPA